MEMTTSATIATTTESETPPRIHPTKPMSFTNGVLKQTSTTPSPPTTTTTRHAVVIYKECLKNHAASMGGLALDGCGEFMPATTANASDPTSLKCAACGCHRNFHRREPDDSPPQAVSPVIEYHPQHRHHPLPPPPAAPRSPGSQSPPPISSTYYPGSAPHMLLALSGGANPEPSNTLQHHHQQQYQQNKHNNNLIFINSSSSGNPSRKRFRTKFTQDQKDKMYQLAEKVGWKMHKSNEDIVNVCCSEISVERGVFKVWMHNNKNTFGKRSGNSGDHPRIDLGIGNDNGNGNGNSHSGSSPNPQHNLQLQFGSNESNAPTNASSSSS